MSDCCDNKKTKLRDNCCDDTSGGYVTAYCDSRLLGDILKTNAGIFPTFAPILGTTYTVPAGSTEGVFDLWYNCQVRVGNTEKVELYVDINGTEVNFTRVKSEISGIDPDAGKKDNSLSILACSITLGAGDTISIYGSYLGSGTSVTLGNSNILIKKN